MLTEIEQHCQACAACVEYSAKPPRQHSLATPVPPAIAHTLGLDFALVHDKKKAPLKVLILTDYLSGWITYFKFTKPPAAEAIVHKLSLHFHQSGWPSVVCTDGEGVLTSRCFTSFLKENGILHRLSSPEWAPSNGAAEAAVHSFKRIWYRCLASGDDFVEAWSLYNDTPRQAGQLSACHPPGCGMAGQSGILAGGVHPNATPETRWWRRRRRTFGRKSLLKPTTRPPQPFRKPRLR